MCADQIAIFHLFFLFLREDFFNLSKCYESGVIWEVLRLMHVGYTMLLSAAANLGSFSFTFVLWVFSPGGNAEINATVTEHSLNTNLNACLQFIVLHHLLLELWAVKKVKKVNYFPRTIIMWRKYNVANKPYLLFCLTVYCLFFNLVTSAFKCIRPTVGN